jgi:hypothetical protein
VRPAAAQRPTAAETQPTRPMAGRAHAHHASRGTRVWPSVLTQIVAAAGLASRSLTPFPSPRWGLGSAGPTAAFLALVGSPNHIPQEGSDEHRGCYLEFTPDSALGRTLALYLGSWSR